MRPKYFLLDRCYIHVRFAYGRCNVDNLWNNLHINPEMALIETLDISVTFLFCSYRPFFHSLEWFNRSLYLSIIRIVQLFYDLNNVTD